MKYLRLLKGTMFDEDNHPNFFLFMIAASGGVMFMFTLIFDLISWTTSLQDIRIMIVGALMYSIPTAYRNYSVMKEDL